MDVGDEEIEVGIAVEVSRRHRDRAADAQRLAAVGEDRRAVVEEEPVGLAGVVADEDIEVVVGVALNNTTENE